MNLDYSVDRTPTLPVSLLVGDRIRTVHAEGQPPEDVDIVVETKVIEREDGALFGDSTAAITYTGADGKQAGRKFKNANVWLSVDARIEPTGAEPHAETGVAA